MKEVGVIIGFDGQPTLWHQPEGRSGGSIPDTRELWDALWAQRHHLTGFAHSHPGGGYASPSGTDLTTFAAIEAALGRRLVWWIANEQETIVLLWQGPGPHQYKSAAVPEPSWVAELRRRSTEG